MEKIYEEGSPESVLFKGTRKWIEIRKKYLAFGDFKNIRWMPSHNNFIAGYIRYHSKQTFYCLFNYNNQDAYLTWYAFKDNGDSPSTL